MESGLHLSHPLMRDGDKVGAVMIGVDPRYVRDTMGSIFADIGISLFVAVLIILELTLLVLSLAVVRSIGLMQGLMRAVGEGDFSVSVVSRGRDDLSRVLDAMNRVNSEINRRFRAVASSARAPALAKLREGRVFAERGALRPVQIPRAGDVQYPMFFFIFGVELSRSFFPLFVRDLYDPSLGIDESIAIALPMSVWVVAMLVTTPLALKAIRQWGVRETLLIGMAPTSIGLIATAFAGGFVDLIVWRCVTAAGFGLVHRSDSGSARDDRAGTATRAQSRRVRDRRGRRQRVRNRHRRHPRRADRLSEHVPRGSNYRLRGHGDHPGIPVAGRRRGAPAPIRATRSTSANRRASMEA